MTIGEALRDIRARITKIELDIIELKREGLPDPIDYNAIRTAMSEVIGETDIDIRDVVREQMQEALNVDV